MKKIIAQSLAFIIAGYYTLTYPLDLFTDWLEEGSFAARLLYHCLISLASMFLAFMAFQLSIALRVLFLTFDVGISGAHIVQSIREWLGDRRHGELGED